MNDHIGFKMWGSYDGRTPTEHYTDTYLATAFDHTVVVYDDPDTAMMKEDIRRNFSPTRDGRGEAQPHQSVYEAREGREWPGMELLGQQHQAHHCLNAR
ncbi:hypothetical protein [Sphingobium sp. IP1]|uniref:hypothetical protein n=1 Tax=Sphingobium sp. IP1 TaxID=2021637 RepID=UPI00211EB09A|nr:hypothetical protein [Sphingobium sp. IP1]